MATDRRSTVVAGMAVLVVVAVLALSSVSFLLERARYRERAQVMAQNVVTLLAAQLGSDFRRLDLAVADVAGAYRQEAQRGTVSAARCAELVGRLRALFPELEGIGMTDANGEIRASRPVAREAGLRLADRAYFVTARQHPDAGLIVDGPLRSRLTERPVIVLAHPLRDGDGRFAGVVFASLSPEYFRSVLDKADLGVHGAATVRSENLSLVYRNPAPADAEIGAQSVSAELRQAIARAPTGGDYVATTALDGVERANAYRRVDHYPFYVLAGVAAAEYLDDWRRNAIWLALFSGVLILTVVTAALVFCRMARRQETQARALAAEADKFETVLRTSADGIHVLNAAGKLVLANPAFFALIGRDEKDATWLAVDDWDDGAAVHMAYAAPGSGGLLAGEIRQVSTRYRRAGGELLEIEASLSRFCLGEDWCLLVSARDVTEKKRSMEMLEFMLAEHRKLNDELAFRVRQAEAANRARDAFLACMSHELRTPLNGIMGMTQLVQRHLGDAVEKGRLEKVLHAARQLQSTLGDLLELSRCEAGRIVLENAPFSLRGLAARLEALARGPAQDKGLVLRVDWPEALLQRTWHGDAERLEQIAMNFARNAVKFSTAGEIAVRVRLVEENGALATLRFEIVDHAVEITAEERQRLLADFSPPGGAFSRYNGAALGLSISRRLVELMGGAAGVDSGETPGATYWFTVRLGVSGETSAVADAPNGNDAEENAEAALVRRFPRARILIVEDEPVHQEFVTGLLIDAGLAPTVVSDGETAIAMLSAQPFDLVLMDMQLPRLDGAETCRRMRARHGEALPILALTAHVGETARRVCLDAGMDGVLFKPLEAAYLFQAVLHWLIAGSSRSSGE